MAKVRYSGLRATAIDISFVLLNVFPFPFNKNFFVFLNNKGIKKLIYKISLFFQQFFGSSDGGSGG
jgi:hypothetical protein